MSSPALTQPPSASLLTPHLSPTLSLFSSPDLDAALLSHAIPDLLSLLTPFHSSVNKLHLRTATYSQTFVPSFPIHLHHRTLPPSLPNPDPPVTPSTPFAYPSQNDRDDLFLDSLGEHLSRRVDHWLADPHTLPELNVRGVKLRPRLGEELEEKERKEENELEGCEGRTAEELMPWFKALKDETFARREMVDWETFNWPIGCLLALSTSSPDPLNTLSHLWELSSPSSLFSPASYPPRSGAEEDGRHEWANGDVLRFVVLVHDFGAGGGKEAWEDAQILHDTIRKTYGLHTALLPLFSASPAAPPQFLQPPSDAAAGLYSSLTSARTTAAATQEAKEVVGLGYDVPEGGAIPGRGAAATPTATIPPPAPSVPGHDLSDADLHALAKFMRELVVQSIVPWMERAVVVGNEQYMASKRSIGGRLFSAGRKYFGGGGGGGGGGDSAGSSRAGSPGPGGGATGASASGYNAVKGYYPHSSPASSHRRLADLSFLLSDYKLAHQVYDSLARDTYKPDKAWRHYAAAMRMVGICQLLLLNPSAGAGGLLQHPSAQGSPDQFLALAAQAPGQQGGSFDSLRATLFYHSLYTAPSLSVGAGAGNASAAAVRGLLRVAEGLGEEIAGAVLLEAAGVEELRAGGTGGGGAGGGGKVRKRKYAMWMALAGVRYEKCGVKSLSRRCLSQASTLYSLPPPPYSPDSDEPPAVSLTSLSDPRLPSPSPSSPSPSSSSLTTFSAIHSTLHHSLGRQAYTVGDSLSAVQHFLQLLSSPSPASAATSEIDWLDDFILAFERLDPSLITSPSEAERNGLRLPTRLVEAQKTRVRVGTLTAAGAGGDAVGEGEAEREQWRVMEEGMKAGEGWLEKGGKKPKELVYRGGGGGEEAVVGELFHLELPVLNPLEQSFLSLGSLKLETDAEEGELEVRELGEVELAPGEGSKIFIPLVAHSPSKTSYTLHSLTYTFASLLPVREPLSSPSVRFSKPSVPLPGKPSVRSAMPLVVKVRGRVAEIGVEMEEVAEEEKAGEGEGRRGLPKKLFLGETVRRSITVVNTGSVAVGEVFAMCSRPEFALVLPSSASSADVYTSSSPSSSSSSSSSPTTATIPNHLRSNAPVSFLATGEVLQPGEKKVVEVLVRGNEVGQIDLKWLFAFRAAEDGASEVFTTRATHRVDVYPSLEVRCDVRPNAREGSPFNLGIEAYNAGLPASDVILTSLSLVSPRWTLSLPPSSSFEDDISLPLGWQQSSSFFLALDAAVDSREGEMVDEAAEFTCRQVEALLGAKEVKKVLPGAVEVKVSSVASASSLSPDPLSPTLLACLLASYNTHRLTLLSASFPTLPPSQLPSLFPLLPSLSSAFLLLFYSSASLRTQGHLLVPLPSLQGSTAAARDAPLKAVLEMAERTAGRGLYEESQRERETLLAAFARSEVGGGGRSEGRAPVEGAEEVREVVQHDFSSGPCSLPIRFHLRNLSPTTPLEYTLSLGSSNASPRGAILSGSLTHTGVLPPLALSTISSSTLWIPRPGTHRAGDWRITVKNVESGSSWTVKGAAREVRVRDTAVEQSQLSARAVAAQLPPPVPLVIETRA